MRDALTSAFNDISIHAPPRGATGAEWAIPEEHSISIHAPPRGATIVVFSLSVWRCISIHAPPRGATRLSCRHRPRLDDFNSRPSARGDGNIGKVPCFLCISIHAPPRGATAENEDTEPKPSISIHAPPRGATAAQTGKELMDRVFQFTPLREGRLVLPELLTHDSCYFNSRPSARGDPRR